jgi:hypothetical protein
VIYQIEWAADISAPPHQIVHHSCGGILIRFLSMRNKRRSSGEKECAS